VRLGFVDNDGNIVTKGATPDGGGWFLNIVGVVYENEAPLPGIWGRLRLNGGSENLPAFSNAITIYYYSDQLGGWTTDGVSLANEWVGNIGLIA